ncbi:hypothetical protein MNBD_GAMMA11-2556 [hydrothermal vent metagenome]|uniref:DUF3298 domain-containing protein n=1 Tax=hydrothermal vent metagenome TaxID=652676 RepID=A0A3B0XCX8_9ZZZZ
MNVVLNKSYFFILLVVCAFGKGVHAGLDEVLVSSSNEKLSSDVSYRMIEKEEGGDNDSPMGFWGFLKSYPEINNSGNEIARIKINKTIESLSNKYICEEKKAGDYNFSAEVQYIGERIFSVKYGVVWLCGSMVSPDDDYGAIVFDLKTGERVEFDSEFINADFHKDFYLKIAAEIKEKMATKEKEECPAVDKFNYYYRAKDSLVFATKMMPHFYVWCNVEIKYPLTEMKKYLKPSSILLRK